MTFDLLLNIGHNRLGVHIWHICSLCSYLSNGTNTWPSLWTLTYFCKSKTLPPPPANIHNALRRTSWLCQYSSIQWNKWFGQLPRKKKPNRQYAHTLANWDLISVIEESIVNDDIAKICACLIIDINAQLNRIIMALFPCKVHINQEYSLGM